MSSRYDIETYRETLADGSDGQLLRYLETPSSRPLPDRWSSEHDPLGLVRHEALHERAAELIYNGLSFIALQIAQQSPEVQDQILKGDSRIEFPEINVSQTHSFGFTFGQDKEVGSNLFEVSRTDCGYPAGGFFAVRQQDGSTIVKRDHSDADSIENSFEYPEILAAAQRMVDVLAVKRSIRQDALHTASTTDHFTEAKLLELRREIKTSRRLHRRLGRGVLQAMSIAKNTVIDVFSKPAADKLTRRPAWGRMAIAALVLPLPGYSDHWYEPASVETGQYAAGVIADALHQEHQPDPEELYDVEQIDLPAGNYLAFGSTTQELPVQPLVAGSTEHDTIQLSIEDLHGTSPRRVELANDFAPTVCQALKIDESIQGNRLSLVTTNTEDASLLEISEVTQEAIYLCNQTTSRISADDITLIFDSQPRTNG